LEIEAIKVTLRKIFEKFSEKGNTLTDRDIVKATSLPPGIGAFNVL
jgi:hypothetical protein